jgi:uncharacterized Zn finger protein
MSLGMQHFKPRCHKCKAATRFDREPSYWNLEALRVQGEWVVVRCKACGHVSRRRSLSAHRLAAAQSRKQLAGETLPNPAQLT